MIYYSYNSIKMTKAVKEIDFATHHSTGEGGDQGIEIVGDAEDKVEICS